MQSTSPSPLSISQLRYQVTFSTGRTLGADIKFEKGLTAITGPNETGKSMILEMIRWCLFGTDALRGTADSYTSLAASLDFLDYKVERTLKGGRLLKGKELLCTGTRPINAKIIELLGFDLEVFDISCAATQNQIDQLSKMRPTQRKQMVDRVIGADKIEDLAKWCSQEALLVSRELAILERGVSEPLPPGGADQYTRTSAVLRKEIERFQQSKDELNRLYGWLRGKPPQPVLPIKPTGELGKLIEAEKLLQLPVYNFDPVVAQQAWDDYEKWVQLQEFKSRHPEPEIERARAERLKERRSLVKDLQRLKGSPVIYCPCGKPFTTNDAEMERIQSLIDNIIEDAEDVSLDMDVQLQRITDWEKATTITEWEIIKHARETAIPAVPKRDIAIAARGIHKNDLAKQLGELGCRHSTLASVRTAIQDYRAYEVASGSYDALKAAYDAWMEEAKRVVEGMPALEREAGLIPKLESQLAFSLAYESAMERYEADKLSHADKVKELQERKKVLDSWGEAKEGFNELRTVVKSYLTPSLSRAASSLLSKMTGGDRNTIVVDEDFEVTVDGQPLATLSGSGNACANLALRIGLGQVLTNNVLSVFIGDEIDASMDDRRAENIQNSLSLLRDKVLQIIIITHKIPKAEHVIELGK